MRVAFGPQLEWVHEYSLVQRILNAPIWQSNAAGQEECRSNTHKFLEQPASRSRPFTCHRPELNVLRVFQFHQIFCQYSRFPTSRMHRKRSFAIVKFHPNLSRIKVLQNRKQCAARTKLQVLRTAIAVRHHLRAIAVTDHHFRR